MISNVDFMLKPSKEEIKERLDAAHTGLFARQLQMKEKNCRSLLFLKAGARLEKERFWEK
ncbi:MAG: hypothetical protein LUF92_16655 [Clostridiales bacterium]|nr:hypothetical protein [Clostridiales bacterium]